MWPKGFTMLALPELTVILTAAILTAMGALWWLRQDMASAAPAIDAEPDDMALLFQDGQLQHGNELALTRLALAPGFHDWDDLRDSLLARFPDFPKSAAAGHEGSITLLAADGDQPQEIQIRWIGSRCSVHMPGTSQMATPAGPDVTDMINLLRRASDANPNPSWQTNAGGRIIWHNQAYATLKKLAADQPDSAGTDLFSRTDPNHPARVSLAVGDSAEPDWYALSQTTIDDNTVHHATCINAVIEAEDAKRTFVQTLAKTFAHLSIGLAIFDRKGQLALFNPALMDLTGLPAPFLSARPTMLSFFDQLRETRRMPEPKNYLNWRQEIADVIAAATDGRYQETWSLESGQTYSVMGRPHPDGATAFLIEDISADVALTRNFRAELELGQNLLDHIDDGLAVFTASGVLTFCNASYRDLWGQSPDSSFADITITDSVTLWRRNAAPNPMWPEIEDFVTNHGNREGWSLPICPHNGAPLTCDLTPIAAGATLIRFRATHIGNAAKSEPLSPSHST
tara:strand:- start:24858 stop:26396 length:1539 start_codon:yes stop_codon:yes gene_type:complete